MRFRSEIGSGVGRDRSRTRSERLRVDLNLLHGSSDTVMVDYEDCGGFAGVTRDDIQTEWVEVEVSRPLIDCDPFNRQRFLRVISIGKHVDAAFARGFLHRALLRSN